MGIILFLTCIAVALFAHWASKFSKWRNWAGTRRKPFPHFFRVALVLVPTMMV